MDAVCFALKLGYPRRGELLDVGDIREDRFRRWSAVRYDFPLRGDLPPVFVHWHEGNQPNTDGSSKGADGKPSQTRPNLPAASAQLEKLAPALAKSRSGAGNMLVGEKGMSTCSSHDGRPCSWRESRRKEFTLPGKTLPRPVGGIMGDFLGACQAGGGPTCSDTAPCARV